MVELKCRAELAVTGRSACRNADCEHSKEKGGRIPQGKLRWGIGGPGGHSMKWYCIRPACIPYDQVKDMLVPEKCENAADMEGISELPPGFREATIAFLEAIRDDKTDQLDPAHRAKLDEVGPMLPVPPRTPVATRPDPSAAPVGRQSLRRMKRSFKGGAASADENASDDDRYSGDDDDHHRMGMGHRGGGGGSGMMSIGGAGSGGGGGGSSSSSPSSLSRTVSPPALLIPRRTDSSGHGGSDSPILPPPMKMPRLDDPIGGGGGAVTGLVGVGGVGGLTGGLGGGLGVVGGLGIGSGLETVGGGLGIGGEALTAGAGGLGGDGLGLDGSGLVGIGGGIGGSGIVGGGIGGDDSTAAAATAAAAAAAAAAATPVSSSSSTAAAGGGTAAADAAGISPPDVPSPGSATYHAFGGLSLYPSGAELSPSGGTTATMPIPIPTPTLAPAPAVASVEMPTPTPHQQLFVSSPLLSSTLSPSPSSSTPFLGTPAAAAAPAAATAAGVASTSAGSALTAAAGGTTQETKPSPSAFMFGVGGTGGLGLDPSTDNGSGSALVQAPTGASLLSPSSLGSDGGGGAAAAAAAEAATTTPGFPQETRGAFSPPGIGGGVSGSALVVSSPLPQHQEPSHHVAFTGMAATGGEGSIPAEAMQSAATLVPGSSPSTAGPTAAATEGALSPSPLGSPGVETLDAGGSAGGGNGAGSTEAIASAFIGEAGDLMSGEGSVLSAVVPAGSMGFGEVGAAPVAEGGLLTGAAGTASTAALSEGGNRSSAASVSTTAVTPATQDEDRGAGGTGSDSLPSS